MSNEGISEQMVAQAPAVEMRDVARAPVEQQDNDKKHLDTLSLIYYIFAAMNGFSVVVLTLGSLIAGVILLVMANGNNAGPTWIAIVVIAGGVVGGFVGACVIYLVYKTGRSLAERKRPTLCFVVACLMCFNPPLGTLLGIFTIVVLRRASVKELFNLAKVS